MTSLLASRDRHQLEKYFWMLMIIPTMLWWKESILWVAMMSIWALIKGCDASHEARNGGSCPQCAHCKEQS